MKQAIISAAALALAFGSFCGVQAQTDLIKKVNQNQEVAKIPGFQFTEVSNLAGTAVENQGNSGTCWSYSTNSFLESEMIKAGKKPLHLSKIFSARMVYLEKAENYLRMDGNLNYGDGGQAHDVINMYAKYGTLPEAAYTGLIHGATENNFGAMQKEILAQLKSWVSARFIPANWKDSINGILDAHLGKVPASFDFQGKTYTPKSFAKEYVGLNPANYVEIMSQSNSPYWTRGMLMVPDNWSYSSDYLNVPMEAITKIIDGALQKGYSVEWDTDCSEPYFSWLNSVAIVPPGADTMQTKGINKARIQQWFSRPSKELTITEQNRQAAYNDKKTTDDHLMHIVGQAKDQNGKPYYIVKNSWGTANIYKGFLYASKAFINYKTVAILVNKDALSPAIKQKFQLQ